MKRRFLPFSYTKEQSDNKDAYGDFSKSSSSGIVRRGKSIGKNNIGQFAIVGEDTTFKGKIGIIKSLTEESVHNKSWKYGANVIWITEEFTIPKEYMPFIKNIFRDNAPNVQSKLEELYFKVIKGELK